MPDMFDAASELEDLERAAAIAAVMKHAPAAEATGACLFCDEVLPEGRRFCGPECRDAFELQVRQRRRFPPVA
jgi:hypothetical protein